MGRLFLRELQKIIESQSSDQVGAVYDLLIKACLERVKDLQIEFNTDFALIAYIGHRHQLPGVILYNAHVFRKGKKFLELGIRVTADFIRLLYKPALTPSLMEGWPDADVYAPQSQMRKEFHVQMRVLVIRLIAAESLLMAYHHEQPEQPLKVRYNLPDRNESFNESIAQLEHQFSLPIQMNLLDVEIDADGYLLPRAFVFEPDFLFDITTIAECFQRNAISTHPHLTKKFLPRNSSIYLLIGNIANFFLDELMANPKVSFQSLLNRIFVLDPLGFALLNDGEARKLVQDIQKHFVHLREVIVRSLRKFKIDPEACYLEPSFYSEMHGLQGRLDVLYDDPNRADDASIIELKSGQPYQPNVYGLSAPHYVQTLLYDLVIKASSKGRLKPTNYILYSKLEVDQLKFAPAIRSIQYEAMAVRNHLLAIDQTVASLDEHLDDPTIFAKLLKRNSQYVSGFAKRDMEQLSSRYEALSELEKKYVLANMAFVSREHRLAKVGQAGSDRNRGQAGLWLSSLADKEKHFTVLKGLSIAENRSDLEDPVIIFLRTDATNPLANFRQGDLALIYPLRKGHSPLENQIFKGTITMIDSERVIVKLRAKQFNQALFTQFDFWNIEHDMLDSSFAGLYRAIYQFMSFDDAPRKTFLTLSPPLQPHAADSVRPTPAGLTQEQQRIFHKILSAPEYFLLWGPPGTGKTSILLKEVVRHLLEETDEKLVILAYTNRAVDEICAALAGLGSEVPQSYFRVGSRHGSDNRFHEQLLSHKIMNITSRKDLLSMLHGHRIVVGTVSSFSGKSELTQIMSFDRVIIDEATQILEPTMAGILPLFKKSLLIGDHRQLAAVVVQSRNRSSINDAGLQEMGLENLANSYFERLYRRCIQKGWDWAYDQLTHQGRMHRDVMEFPSRHFYDNRLTVLPDCEHQITALVQPPIPASDDPLDKALSTRRVVFVPVSSQALYRAKTNAYESKMVCQIVERLIEFDRGMSDSIGIITPFRAQIALIKQDLQNAGLDTKGISIDTVERYQGGARKIVVISLCVSSPVQMETLVSKSSDGVDRKFNVALTRAREQLVVVGDPSVISVDPVYADFINTYRLN